MFSGLGKIYGIKIEVNTQRSREVVSTIFFPIHPIFPIPPQSEPPMRGANRVFVRKNSRMKMVFVEKKGGDHDLGFVFFCDSCPLYHGKIQGNFEPEKNVFSTRVNNKKKVEVPCGK